MLALLGVWLPATVAIALPEDADQPIHIRADRAEIDQNAQVVTYRGSVQAAQGTLKVTADEMVVEYRDQKVTRIIARGEPATYEQQLEKDQGIVRADARTITYHTQQERIDLEGEAFLTQGGNRIAGQMIHYDIVAGRVNAESGDQGPVEVTVQPAARNP
ncbi:MAG: lipopolysaccharide transport periplasmic protein LptA [Pseudomonadales bacterium]